MKYDVIVIGSGIAGLTASLKLAKSGKKVALFEKHSMPGGYATNFKRKDKDGNIYTFDSSLHSLSGMNDDCTVYNLLKNLDILNDITVLKKEDSTAIYKNNEFFVIPSDVNEFQNALIKKYPEFESGIIKLFDFIKIFYEDIKDISLNKSEVPKYQLELESISLESFIKSYVDNSDFIENFSYLWGYNALPPSELNALYYLLTLSSYIIGGHAYIKGGSGELSNIFKHHIEKYGSHVFLRSEVIKITTKNNKVISITTNKNETFEANEFIFACDPNHIFSLIDDPITNDYKDKLKTLEKSSSITQLFLALDCSSEDIGNKFSNIYIQKDSIKNSFVQSKLGNLENTHSNVAFYDKMDPTLNTKGCTIHITSIDFSENWPERGTEQYKEMKSKITDILLNKLTKLFPKVKDHIKVAELGTPKTMERYTNNTTGSIYGWAQNTNQGGFNRPSFGTPFNNALIVGSWSFPGGGFEGAIFSGFIGANRILSKNLTNIQNSSNKLFPIDTLMEGLTHKFNPKNAENLNITYKFLFEGNEPIYLEVKNQTSRLLPKSEIPSKIDTTISTTHEIWNKISFNEISGKDALMDGLLKCEGNLKNFALIPHIFNKSLN